MKFLSLVIATCVFASAHAQFGVWVYDSEGVNNDTTALYCVPFDANVTDIVEWYSYGDPVANSFNNLLEYTTDMANRATFLAVATLGGHDPLSDTSFGFVFGSTDETSVEGGATLSCTSPQWIGLRNDPVRVLDDTDETPTFDHMSGNAEFSFEWAAGETDGFLVYDIYEHLECHMGDATGLTETIGLIDNDEDAPWTATNALFETGSRVVMRQSCSVPEDEDRDTDDAVDVDFEPMEGVASDGGDAHGHLWWNATAHTLDWEIEWSSFTSQIQGIELRNGDDVIESLGSTDEYWFTPTGTTELSHDDGEAFEAGELSLVIVTNDNPTGELIGAVTLDEDSDDEMDGASRSAAFAAPMVVLLSTSVAAML